ncbi:hypothetical protein C5167_006782 [Papaver somniferum]|uniref:GYF domain-containing protein n=1 Tax=Papaver somniferum TaxID=3469 RepID=A0A4Y7JG28_PAPSO|nr:uncharacterized protein LOC113271387 isoform X1 [Papaver somniferum]RZC59476.1 hypothetical protein C5167_006782 [Papaver somniferum]
MAKGKVDFLEDLVLPKAAAKDEGTGGNNDAKSLLGFLDDSKDQASDNIIPLSPQWLYAKPTDIKPGVTNAQGDLRNSTDLAQKDGWRLVGSQDKKDRGKIGGDTENARRWREEERETGVLGRRRKEDRRSDSVSSKEAVEARALPSSDRWHDVSNRNSGHESQRDGKWSSRWGPDDKEKESRTEKKVDSKKEESYSDKQSSSVGNRAILERETDSRDKWRPRHRLELHSGGSSTHRAAPGFGSERGRIEPSIVGFAPGRGRASIVGSPSLSRPSSSGPIGAAPVDRKRVVSADAFCYPRGKLLDIYRKQKLVPSFGEVPLSMVEISPVTQKDLVEPLAFVSPQEEEEGVLNEIWKGRLTSSGVVYSSRDKSMKSNGDMTGITVMSSIESQQGVPSTANSQESRGCFSKALIGDEIGVHDSQKNLLDAKEAYHSEGGNKALITVGEHHISSGLASLTIKDCDVGIEGNSGSSVLGDNLKVGENGLSVHSGSVLEPKLENIDSVATLESRNKPFSDSSSLQEVSSTNEQFLKNNEESNQLERDTPPEEWSLFYKDPQGETQGPFLGVDIISWFDQGFFGTDLLVCLSDAPDGTAFQELGDLMPHLKLKSLSNSDGNLVSKLDNLSDAVSSIPEPSHPDSQNLHDVVPRDKEVLFRGRRGSSNSNSNGELYSNINEVQANSANIPVPDDLNKLHPFGLLLSELEGTNARHTQLSNMSPGNGDQGRYMNPSAGMNIPFVGHKQSSFDTMAGSPVGGEEWSDIYRKSMPPNPNSSGHFSRIEQESDRFDLAEQFMAQQLHQQNVLSSHSSLHSKGLSLEQFPTSSMEQFQNSVLALSRNPLHQQQSITQQRSELELLKLRLQQEQQLQLQLQQQQQLHQRRMQLQQQQQQEQQQKLLLEQLLHQKMHNRGFGQSEIDHLRASNMVDQVLMRQRLRHELQQQQSRSSIAHPDPRLEQLMEARFGQHPHREHHNDLRDLLSRAKQGQIHPQELQLLVQLEQEQAMALAHQKMMEEERRNGAVWSLDENRQFVQPTVNPLQDQFGGAGPADFYHRQQRPSYEEQLSHRDQNLAVHQLLQRGGYEPDSVPFERSISLPNGGSGLNLDGINALAHLQGRDIQERHTQMHPAGQMNNFSSGIQSHHQPHIPDQFLPSNFDALERRSSESNGQHDNNWIESRIQQMHLEAERQRRESVTGLQPKEPSSWVPTGVINGESSDRVLMDLMHRKQGMHSEDPNLARHSFNLFTDQQAGLSNSFTGGTHRSNVGNSLQDGLVNVGMDERHSSLETGEPFSNRSHSGALHEEELFFSSRPELSQTGYGDSGMRVASSTVERDSPEGKVENKRMSEGMFTTDWAISEAQVSMYEQGTIPRDSGELSAGIPSRHTSLGNSEGRQDSETMSSSGMKDTSFRRTSSSSDTDDASETSFIDMLKSANKKQQQQQMMVEGGGDGSMELLDGAQGRYGKKKGKKGKQINPALLGFKVTSNRIMMGEIQRLDE